LTSGLLSGKFKYQLTELSALPRAAVVVEDRFSEIFTLTFARPAVVADGLAEPQAGFPNVPIVFWQTRKLAQEYTTAISPPRTPGSLILTTQQRFSNLSLTLRQPLKLDPVPARANYVTGPAASAYRFRTGVRFRVKCYRPSTTPIAAERNSYSSTGTWASACRAAVIRFSAASVNTDNPKSGLYP
jgi:hypothetical protein